MKKLLLFSIIFCLIVLSAVAYETVIIKFPEGELWGKVYYKQFGNEALLQYTPAGQKSNDWTRSVVIHSYNGVGTTIMNFSDGIAAKMQKVNPTSSYTTIKMRSDDIILGRCTQDYKNIKGQCEFLRTTRSHAGIVTIHYMNKNKNDFMANYNQWYDIIKRAKFLNTYYRNERTLNKSDFFEI